jgi:hypothetical protein
MSMVIQAHNNRYAQILKEQGSYVIRVGDVDWYDYGGFMIPAYLPHHCPVVTRELAIEVLRKSGRAFVRWDTQFGQLENSEWWYVLKRGPWAVESVKDKKKRWMIRQGKKHFTVRPLMFDEVISKCPKVAQIAAERYKGQADVESHDVLEKRAQAAQKVPGVLEYIGCFYEDTLVSYSENYIQDDAVWLAVIRHNPEFLNKHSSYGLMDGILDYYLNEQKMDYVLDGCRSIHHRTEFQEHLIRVFGFTKEYAMLNVVYSPEFRLAVKLAFPFRSIVRRLRNKWTNRTLDNIGAVLMQEYIRRACDKRKHL